jgi:hypothetical protein
VAETHPTAGQRALELAQAFLHANPDFNSKEAANRHDRTHVVCLGDSHIQIFHHVAAGGLLPQAWFSVCCIPGATAQGMVNPFSVTDALNTFRSRLDMAATWQPIVFQLGEVDCGFLVWYRAQRDGISVGSQVETSLANYAAFLDEVLSRGYGDVYVLSVPLPTIRDGQDWGEVAHARRTITATQSERTELTLSYNERLAEISAARSAVFVDVTSFQLDPVTGLVADSLLHPDRANHHLNPAPYARVVAEKLGVVLG